MLLYSMTRHNPISPKRLHFLTEALQKKLTRTNQADLWAQLEPKLKHLGEADPTSSGAYCSWILHLLAKKNVDLPEDSEKLRELLEIYHRVKPRLPIEFRDVNKFESYAQLRITLLPLLPTLKSIAELEQDGSALLATAPLGGDVYQIYRLTTAEAASAAAKNSGWCVCNKETAADYLKEGPLYLIIKNDDRFALCHAASHQVMSINDEPLCPDNPAHSYRQIQELLRKYLPEMLCPIHKDSSTYGLPKESIANLECVDCQATGCGDCGFGVCGGSYCSNMLCGSSEHKCDGCGQKICDDDAAKSCKKDSHHCLSCVPKCNLCDGAICEDCGMYVDCCETAVCHYHYSDSCGYCSDSFCSACAEFVNCGKCGESGCGSCVEKWVSCRCSRELSFTCDDCAKDCFGCSDKLCSRCEVTCEECDNSVCRQCSSYCRRCQAPYCDAHPHQVCFIGGRSHDYHGDFTRCSFHPLVDEDGDPIVGEDEDYPIFCSKHSVACDSCDKQVCRLCLQICQCPERHSLCPVCAPLNICPVCNEATCDPSQHMHCAYVRRHRLRRRT